MITLSLFDGSIKPAWSKRVERIWSWPTRWLIEARFLFGDSIIHAHRCRRGRWWLKVPKSVHQPVGIYVPGELDDLDKDPKHDHP